MRGFVKNRRNQVLFSVNTGDEGQECLFHYTTDNNFCAIKTIRSDDLVFD